MQVIEEIREIPYTPRYPELHNELRAHRYSVLVAHRRFGKTVLVVNHLLDLAMQCQRTRGMYAYVAPFRNQAKQVAWSYLRYYTGPIEGRKVNEGELSVELPNGAVIRLFGADNPDALRGMYFDCVVLDEVAQMKPQVWEEIIRPALADRGGSAVFIGTPKGENLFHEMYLRAVDYQKKGNPDWCALMFRVDQTSALTEKEVADLKEEMSDNAFRQEFMCDFSASSDDILISLDVVDKAMEPHLTENDVREYPLVIGVDVARFGEDASVIFPRKGLVAYEPIVMRKLDNVQLAHRVVAYIAEHKPVMCCIDQGQGTGVIDMVRRLAIGYPTTIVEVPFGSKANHPEKFLNRRAEMWVGVREWLKEGAQLPESAALRAELTAPTYEFDMSGRIKLERKEDVKERLKHSTDLADALALTFAVPVAMRAAHIPTTAQTDYDVMAYGRQQAASDYDVFAYGS